MFVEVHLYKSLCIFGNSVIGCWMCLCEDCYCFYDLLSFQYWS